ncbi:hypothetical protein HU200_012716 [Digitaria exilis]|uniref:Pectin acetylesterase n=1 Tax=Digitaria exilis TaxID=1010633 RepID=A0A835FEJ7_9POAL|nr:hypothetical protein HU200_012716 [Digitaria exilis]
MPSPFSALWRRRAAALALALLATALLFTLSRYAAVSSDFPPPSPTYGHRLPTLVDLTLVYDRDALCLDGTPPGYHFLPGFGQGSHSWILHLEGGSWCRNFKSCARRKKSNLGSSAHMDSRVEFVGILSDDESQNPDFYNWNKVRIRYCDGASFSGTVQDEVKNGTGFFFRGQRIWEAVMADLLSKGLSRAKQVYCACCNQASVHPLHSSSMSMNSTVPSSRHRHCFRPAIRLQHHAFLTGCSAGGLSTYIHCDDFRALLPKTPMVKCLADGGFFLDVEDISGRRYMRAFYNDVARLQDVRKKFPRCSSDMEPGQIGMSPLLFPDFTLQVEHVLSPEGSDPQNLWRNCRMDITKCTTKQLEILQGFRKALLDAINEFKNRRGWGMFIDSCFIHCQSMKAITWHSPSAARINNKTAAEAVGDWFFDRREVKEIDCEYPCNPTCYNVALDEPYKQD